jgi:hypothetical protein
MIKVVRENTLDGLGASEHVDKYPNADEYKITENGLLSVTGDEEKVAYAPGEWKRVILTGPRR